MKLLFCCLLEFWLFQSELFLVPLELLFFFFRSKRNNEEKRIKQHTIFYGESAISSITRKRKRKKIFSGRSRGYVYGGELGGSGVAEVSEPKFLSSSRGAASSIPSLPGQLEDHW